MKRSGKLWAWFIMILGHPLFLPAAAGNLYLLTESQAWGAEFSGIYKYLQQTPSLYIISRLGSLGNTHHHRWNLALCPYGFCDPLESPEGSSAQSSSSPCCPLLFLQLCMSLAWCALTAILRF